MAKKIIDEEPMLEEDSDEILLEETTSEETLLEESGESEVLLEESSDEVLLEESSNEEILLEESAEDDNEEAKKILGGIINGLSNNRRKTSREAEISFEQGEKLYKEEEYEEAAKWYRKAAEDGHVAAQYRLGLCYEGIDQYKHAAKYWMRKAAEQGYAAAQNQLGDWYSSGNGGVTQNDAEAVKWYKLAACQDDSQAQFNLGECYYNARGVAQDYAMAAEWYQKAAEQGNRIAQYALACCYYEGKGLSQDYSNAVRWYLKFVEQRKDFLLGKIRGYYKTAYYHLGLCYYHGNGVSKDQEKAMEFLKKSADMGYAEAQRKLEDIKEAEEEKSRKEEEAAERRRKEDENRRKAAVAERKAKEEAEEERREAAWEDYYRAEKRAEERAEKIRSFLKVAVGQVAFFLFLAASFYIYSLFDSDDEFSWETCLGAFIFVAIIGNYVISYEERDGNEFLSFPLFCFGTLWVLVVGILIWRGGPPSEDKLITQLKTRYDSVYSVGKDGLRIVEKDGKKGLVDNYGEEVLGLNYDDIHEPEEHLEKVIYVNEGKEEQLEKTRTRRIVVKDEKKGLVLIKSDKTCFVSAEAAFDSIFYDSDEKTWHYWY